MANSFALIEKYMQNAIDSVFATESKTNILENGSKFIDVNFKEAGVVKIMSLVMDGLSDYYRANGGKTGTNFAHYPQGDGYKSGNAEGSWEYFKLNYDRGKQFQIDNMDDEESAGLIIGNLLTEFLRTKVVPEVDAVRFSKMAGKCSVSLGNLVTETIAENKIIANFNAAFEWLTEHEVPTEEQVIFVNPSVMTLIRNTTELYKRVTQEEYKSGDIAFTIDKYEGRPIIEVPSSRFFTDVAVGDNGYYAKATSKVVNYMIVSKKAILPIVKLNKSKIWTPETVQDFDGYKVNFRLYHDVIIPKNKIAGVYTSVGNVVATTKSNILSVNVAKTSGGLTLKEYFTNPAGILGSVIYSSTAIAVGTKVTLGATNKAIAVGTEFTKVGSETKAFFALIDANGTAVASSNEVTLPIA